MTDSQIVELFWQRDERAITESSARYGRYCHAIAYAILQSQPDSAEVVNDTWLRAWQAMPPHRPAALNTFLGKITRRLALTRLRDSKRLKRGGGQVALALDELRVCAGGPDPVDALALRDALNAFLEGLKPDVRAIFVARYWRFASIEQIAAHTGLTKSAVKSALLRCRKKLKAALESEGYNEGV